MLPTAVAEYHFLDFFSRMPNAKTLIMAMILFSSSIHTHTHTSLALISRVRVFVVRRKFIRTRDNQSASSPTTDRVSKLSTNSTVYSLRCLCVPIRCLPVTSRFVWWTNIHRVIWFYVWDTLLVVAWVVNCFGVSCRQALCNRKKTIHNSFWVGTQSADTFTYKMVFGLSSLSLAIHLESLLVCRPNKTLTMWHILNLPRPGLSLQLLLLLIAAAAAAQE